MNKGGIFNSFGAADLAGQVLKLAPASQGGSAPLASSLQTVLKKTYGMSNLGVDGKWGDCSQQAFINAAGAKPSPSAVVQMLSLDVFGVKPDQVQTWSKTPTCGNSSANPTGDGGYVDPVTLVASQFGIQIPGSGDCAQGYYRNVNTGECDQMESPQQMPPGSSLLSRLKLAVSPIPTLQKVSSDKKFSIMPSASPSSFASRLSALKPSISDLSFAPSGDKNFSIRPFAPGTPQVVGTPGGLGAGAKVALGALAVAALGTVGYLLWKRSQAEPEIESAVANCWQANCWEENCGE